MGKVDFDFDTVNKLLGVTESYKVPDAIMSFIFDKEKREKIFNKFLSVSNDVSFDWFHEYFETEQADRKHKKQDFTPNSVSTVINRISGATSSAMDVAAGTGGITINRWWRDCLKESPLTYMPHEHFYWCEELSDRAVPFLIFSLAVRGMNAVVWNGDSISRRCHGVFFIENSEDNVLAFSDINVMPYTDEVKKYFDVSEWTGEHYPDHLETDINRWAFNVDSNSKMKKWWGDLIAGVKD